MHVHTDMGGRVPEDGPLCILQAIGTIPLVINLYPKQESPGGWHGNPLQYSCLGQRSLVGYSPRVCMLSHFSHVQFFAILWTIARQAPLSKGFSRQEYWTGLPCPPPGDLPDPGIEPVSHVSCSHRCCANIHNLPASPCDL